MSAPFGPKNRPPFGFPAIDKKVVAAFDGGASPPTDPALSANPGSALRPSNVHLCDARQAHTARRSGRDDGAREPGVDLPSRGPAPARGDGTREGVGIRYTQLGALERDTLSEASGRQAINGHDPDASYLTKRIKSFCGAKPPQRLRWTNAGCWSLAAGPEPWELGG
jgi:hypothetical protein